MNKYLSTFVILLIIGLFYCSPTVALAEGRIWTGMYGAYVWENRMDAFRLIKDNGFDIAVANTGDLQNLNTLGLKGIIAFFLTKEIVDDKSKWNTFVEKVKLAVDKYKNNPAVFAWYPVDEPEIQQIPIENIRTITNIIKSIDPGHPIFTVMNKPDKWKIYLPYFDIVAEDRYLTKPNDTPEVVRDNIRKLKSDVADLNLRTSIWAVVGALDMKKKSSSKSNYHKANRHELKKMVEICMQENVSGILVYTLKFKGNSEFNDWDLMEQDPTLWGEVKNIPNLVNK
jgi:hypothetical protein